MTYHLIYTHQRIGSNCNFFPGWGDKNSMDRHELNNVCILRCPTLDSCHDTDMHLSVNMALIMNVKIFDDALLIYIAANGINSITNSEIYCPLLNGNNYAKTCVIESSCIAIDNFIPIDGHINEIAMTEHVSIYSGNGYLNLDLGCDFEYENMCTKLLKYSILLCDNSVYDVQDICWIDYDMFICDLQLQCTNYYSNENMIPAARPQLNDAFTINTHFMETLISSHLEAENTLTRNTITNSLFMAIIVITMKGNISIYWNDD